MPSKIYNSQHPYQRTGSHFLRRAGNALLADQPGLGKTIQTLGSILASAAEETQTCPRCSSGGYRDDGSACSCQDVRWHLIVCPKIAVRNVWEPEIKRWLSDHPVEILSLTGSIASREKALAEFKAKPGTTHVFVIVNIESLRVKPVPQPDTAEARGRHDVLRHTANRKGEGKVRMWHAPENGVLPALLTTKWDTVVCDESHRALIRSSNAVPSQTRAGFVLLTARRRVALSGTPMRGKPEQLWGTLNWLYPKTYRSYWKWVETYFSLTSDGFSNYIIAGPKPDGFARMAEDLQRVMLRRTKAEVLPDLPPKTYAGAYLIDGDDQSPLGIWLEMTPKQRKQYDRLASEGLIEDSVVNGPLAEHTRRRQVAGALHDVSVVGDDVLVTPTDESPKLDWLREWLAENGEEKIVVVSQFTALLETFENALLDDYEVVSITGKVSETKRARAVEAFQNGSARVMLLNIAAGGVALTLDAADYLVFLDETPIPDQQEQAEDRVHRASRNHNVTIYYLRMLGTIEEEVAFIAAARQDVQQYLLDGARGVAYARKIYLQSKERKQ